jgi:hypothetical protein
MREQPPAFSQQQFENIVGLAGIVPLRRPQLERGRQCETNRQQQS